MKTMQKWTTTLVEKQCHEVKITNFDETTTLIDKLDKKLNTMVEEKHRQMLRTLNREVDQRCGFQIKEAFRVPDLIGEGAPYSTFANFISTFH